MKTKIYIVLLLGLLSIKSNAQEQFLRFDSIQVIQGEHLATIWSNTFSIHDTVTCPIGGYVQVKYVVLDVETSGAPFDYDQFEITKFRCTINGTGIASINNANASNAIGEYICRPTSFESITKTGLMYNSDLNFKLYGDYYTRTNYSTRNVYFRYRIELHHYSYE